DNSSGHRSKIDIKVLDLAGPISGEHAFDTSTKRPSCPGSGVVEGHGYGCQQERIGTLRAGDVDAADRPRGTDLAVGQSTGRVNDECRRYRGADTTPNRAKPIQSLVERTDDREGRHVKWACITYVPRRAGAGEGRDRRESAPGAPSARIASLRGA